MALPEYAEKRIRDFVESYSKGHYTRLEVPYAVLRLSVGWSPEDIVRLLPEDVIELVRVSVLAMPATRAEREAIIYINAERLPDEVGESFRDFFSAKG